MDTSPTARALQALELVQARPGTTAQAIAVRLGVTERAARRYVAILREAGIPVESGRGRYGGYRIGRGHRPPPLVFTAAEALGLVMAVLDGQHAADDATDPVGAAVDKLIRALPETVARPADTLRRHALAVPRREGARPDAAITSDLVAAVADRCPVRLAYRGAAGPARTVDVDPWAVVVRYGRWYLLCHGHRAQAVRTLRVDRVQGLERLPGTVTPPDDLDAVELLERHLGAGWPLDVRITFDAPYLEVRPWIGAPAGRLEPLEDGARCRLVGTTNNPDGYAAERLAPVPYPFVVEGGPELRAAVARVSARLHAAAGNTGAAPDVDRE